MIVGDNVEWTYQDPMGGMSKLVIPKDVFLVFCAQSESLEHLRVLCFAWPIRKTANAKRKKAVAATV